MKILIIEDESRIAKRIQRMTKSCFGGQLTQLTHCDSLEEGITYLQHHEIDLLLLDLNLNGADGFQVLEQMNAGAFHTIIISAYQDRAITAFEYGVLDFVLKPFTQERLAKAFQRLSTTILPAHSVKYLAVQKRGSLQLIDVKAVIYIKGAGTYTELHLKNGTKAIHNKSLDKLQQLLPQQFERIHKSYLLDMTLAQQFIVASGSKYAVLLTNGEQLPIGRTRYKALKERWLI
ncbi:MAG: LytTR family DNA-binding domain-containing protein [Bacteroidota bacterium]